MAQNRAISNPRSLATKVIAWLLLGQSLLLLLLGIFNLLGLVGIADLPTIISLNIFVEGLTGSIILVALACIGFVATFNFWRLDSIAWTMAMLTEGLLLLTALIIYFEEGANVYAYIMMAYGLFIVIYLHLPDVIGTFTESNEESDNGNL